MRVCRRLGARRCACGAGVRVACAADDVGGGGAAVLVRAVAAAAAQRGAREALRRRGGLPVRRGRGPGALRYARAACALYIYTCK